MGATFSHLLLQLFVSLTPSLTESVGKMLDLCSELRAGCTKSVARDSVAPVLMAYVVVVLGVTQREDLLIYLSLANQDVVQRYLGRLSQYCKEVAKADVVQKVQLLVSHIRPLLALHILIARVLQEEVTEEKSRLQKLVRQIVSTTKTCFSTNMSSL